MLVALVSRLMFARYLLASICALSSDMALFLMLDHVGAAPMLAAFGGYAVGLIVHWTISIRFVFDTSEGPTHAQRAGFVASALLGMGITLGIVSSLGGMGISPVLGKCLAVFVSFSTVYLVRKNVLFNRD